jgi:hypothetical protein
MIASADRSFSYLMTLIALLTGVALGGALADRPAAAPPPPVCTPPPEPPPPEPPPPAAPPPVIETTGIDTCDAYLTIIEDYARCDSVPAATRDAMQQALVTAREGFRSMRSADLPADALRQVADACGQAVAALRSALAPSGCPPQGQRSH